jgi:hypothetical protein
VTLERAGDLDDRVESRVRRPEELKECTYLPTISLESEDSARISKGSDLLCGKRAEKVKPGGIFAGHDYLNGEIPQGLFGVKSAVDEFVATMELPLHVTGKDGFPSWIIEVPESGWPSR